MHLFNDSYISFIVTKGYIYKNRNQFFTPPPAPFLRVKYMLSVRNKNFKELGLLVKDFSTQMGIQVFGS